ncbi:MAG TPA: hypothetical protein VGR87_10360 [Candidatus Limnocylindria bacterium]|nr:hypothetical protein [Candidatus Limnocylindria bacterium]
MDAAIAAIGSVTLARTPEGAFLEVADADAERAQRLLAFAGVRANGAQRALAPDPSTCVALGRDLAPLPLGALSLDLVHVRALPLGLETQRLLRSVPWRRPSVTRRVLVRDLLRGVDAAIGWRRRAWTTREVLRSADARRALRPVVFDRAAIGSPPEHRALVHQGLLARWLFA